MNHKAVPKVMVSAYATQVPHTLMYIDAVKPCVNRSNDKNGNDATINNKIEAGMTARGPKSAPFKKAVSNLFFCFCTVVYKNVIY